VASRSGRRAAAKAGATTTAAEPESAVWTTWRRVGAVVVGIAGVACRVRRGVDGHQTTGTPAAMSSYDLGRMTAYNGHAITFLSPGNRELIGYGSNSYTNDALGVSSETVAGTNMRYTMTPDGYHTATSGSNATSDLRYVSGLAPDGPYHLGAQFYYPSSARWMRQDPLNAPTALQAANRYAYVDGDATNHVAPLGECFIVSCKTYHKAGNLIHDVSESEIVHVVADLASGCASGSLAGFEYGSAAVEPGVGAAFECFVSAFAGYEGENPSEPEKSGQP
jgi:RHS repeat-associated protein